jgi:hypothetical protein
MDIMLDWLRHRDEDVGRLFVNLERIHGTTFNSRVFGEDQILSLDPAVFDLVMSSGFDEFEKGEQAQSRGKLKVRTKVQKPSGRPARRRNLQF